MLGSFFWVTFAVARPISFPKKLGTFVQFFSFDFIILTVPAICSLNFSSSAVEWWIVEWWISKTQILATEDFEAGFNQTLAVY